MHDYSEFKDAPEDLGDNALAELQHVAQAQVDAEARVATLEAQLKEAKEGLDEIKLKRLPDLMDQLELEEFTLKSGVKIKMTENIRGSIPVATQGEAFAWLEERGHERLIKRQFTIEFGKDQEAWAAKFERDCAQRKKPLNLKRKRAVHPQTLCAFVKNQLEEGADVPMDTFGVFRQRVAKVKIPE